MKTNTELADYSEKDPSYFQMARTEILPVLSRNYDRVLEVGCGEGATLRWLKSIDKCGETTGIELTAKAARTARQYIDQVIVGDIEENCILPTEKYDLILCLDVLEHLYDPWKVMERLYDSLMPGGEIIASVPNVRYRSVVYDLLIRGRFEYAETGIMDRTHLRFFTRKEVSSMFDNVGLNQVLVMPHPLKIYGKAAILNMLTFGYFRDLFSWQLIVKGSKN